MYDHQSWSSNVDSWNLEIAVCKNCPLGMPGTRTVAGTDNRSGGSPRRPPGNSTTDYHNRKSTKSFPTSLKPGTHATYPTNHVTNSSHVIGHCPCCLRHMFHFSCEACFGPCVVCVARVACVRLETGLKINSVNYIVYVASAQKHKVTVLYQT